MYIKFDEIDTGKKLIQADNLSRHNTWVPIKGTDTHINIRNSYISASIQQTQFPVTLAWVCTIHKFQGLRLAKSVIQGRQKSFSPGQVYVALSTITNLEGLYLRSTFRKDAIKANTEF